MRRTLLLIASAILTALHASAALDVTLTSSVPSPQLLGKPIKFSAAIEDSGQGAHDYRFRIGLAGQPLRVVKDFQPVATLDWVPYQREGRFVIEVTARNKSTREEASGTQTFQLAPRATADSPALTETANRLVAMYSAPACKPGSSMRVRFQTGAEPPQYTPYQDCVAGLTRNFYVAGMRASTQYLVTHEIKTGDAIVAGKELAFTTQALPADLKLPKITVTHPLDAAGCQSQPILLLKALATDLMGRVVWYNPNQDAVVARRLPGGGILIQRGDGILGEIDLAGNTVRETNVDRVSEQLKALGEDPIFSIHHDATPLPNGHIMTLGQAHRVLTNVQGPGDVTVFGDILIELDQDLQVVWAWNEFDHLDTKRKATLEGETCPGLGSCPRERTWTGVANDWTHSNSVAYTSDGNLLVSVRHQDWVIKIDYQNRRGSGRILWRLGKDGDFKIQSSDPNPWFSHQHDVEIDASGNTILWLYDNGNTRYDSDPTAHSRGQVIRLDEAQHTATLLVNADLGAFSFALGSAQRLCNGDFSFGSGAIQGGSRTTEVTPDGSTVFVLDDSQTNYRSFRMKSMYEQ